METTPLLGKLTLASDRKLEMVLKAITILLAILNILILYTLSNTLCLEKNQGPKIKHFSEIWNDCTKVLPLKRFSTSMCTKVHILYPLKVLTNEKRGGFTVVSFDRSRFKLLSRKFSHKFVLASSYETHKTAPRTLFLSFANYNCFPITL
jgi:hypothetical protein